MISATFLVATFLGQKSLFPVNAPYHSRGEFYALTTKFQSFDISRDDIIRVFGKPDRISKRKGELLGEVLEYGIDPHTSAPTLGAFHFRFGKFCDGSRIAESRDFSDATEPHKQLVPESDLRPILGHLNETTPDWLSDDPLRTIRLANQLIKLGDKKAKYVLNEFERLSPFVEAASWYRTLLAVLFIGKDALPNIPNESDQAFGSFGGGDPTGSVAYYDAKPIRSRAIRPSNDPFEPVIKALKSRKPIQDPIDSWPYLQSLLVLVRGVIQPIDLRLNEPLSRPDLEKFHALFLKESPVWDTDSQSYIRGDGKILPEWPDLPEFRWRIPGMPSGTEFEILMLRIGSSDDVGFSFNLEAMKDKALPNMKIRALDCDRKIEIGSWQAKIGSVTGSGRQSRVTGEGNDLRIIYELPIQRGTNVQIEAITPSYTIRSSVAKL